MIAALGLLRAVPVWAYVVAALLAWGAWQRTLAKSAAADRVALELSTAKAREEALAKAVREQARIATEQGAIADDTKRKLDAARADARRAGDAVRRLREQSASAASAAADSAAAGDCAPAVEAARVHAELLGRAVARAAVLADFADASSAAGEACERSYESLISTQRHDAAQP